jgi:hypothetical protein
MVKLSRAHASRRYNRAKAARTAAFARLLALARPCYFTVMMRTWLVAVGFLAMSNLSACTKCKRGPCDAQGGPAKSELVDGFAGVVSYTSDQIVNGCRECSYGQARLALYPLTQEIEPEQAPGVIDVQAPEWLPLRGKYERAQAPGPYLVCDPFARSCALLPVPRHAPLTLHVRTGYGFTAFVIVDPTLEEAEPEDVTFMPDVPEAVWQALVDAYPSVEPS